MFPEVVRPGTLSRGLHMQLCIGNAIEVLRLLQAGIPIEASEIDVLTGAAKLFQGSDSIGTAPASSAISDASGDMVSAIRAALAPNTMQDLHIALRDLSDALAEIALVGGVDSTSTSISVDDVVSKLTAIRHELAARATVTTDVALSQLSA